MAHRGLCSRREADALIAAGRVRVDGVLVEGLGTRVDQEACVQIDGSDPAPPTVLLHKPAGFVSGQPEHGHPPAVRLLVPANRHPSCRRELAPDWQRGLAPAGRLDLDSTGLLVLTADGRVARQLIGAERSVEKEYSVQVAGAMDSRVLARLRHGLCLDGRPLLPADVDLLGPGHLRFVLHEGRKHQIRRMCRAVGLEVLGLSRLRIGLITLGDLGPGQWRLLGEGEWFEAPVGDSDFDP
jgi:23S rRNA pseudouridine2604 synthase